MVGILVRGCRCATSWCDLDFDLAVVTSSLKILSGYISETVRCRKVILGRDIGYWLGGVGVQRHGMTLICPVTLL